MYSDNQKFTKDNIEEYLKALGKEYRRISGKSMPAEITLIGGASILINYEFRGATTDMDGIIRASYSMKQAINNVGDKYGLPVGWLNDDFKNTSSYSAQIERFSKYYRQYSNVLTVRTVAGEYLIAMKLCSGRQYKNDMSDIVGILAATEKEGEVISLERIDKAVCDLYGSWDALPEGSYKIIESMIKRGDFQKQYDELRKSEVVIKDVLLQFNKDYPGVANRDNVDSIITSLKKRNKTR